MSDEMRDEMRDAQEPEAAPDAPSEAAVAWRAVVAELDALGDAIGRWAKTAVNDPDNKRKLSELGDRLEGLVDDVGAGIKGAAEGEVGQSFKEAADKTGDAFRTAGEKISEEVGPKLAGAFKTMGDKLRGAADRLEERQSGGSAQAGETAPDTSEDSGPDA